MKRLFQWVMAAILICGATVFTACSSNDDNPATPDLNVAEKIIGKWMTVDIVGQATLTSEKNVITFVSPTKAYVSESRVNFTETEAKWSSHLEYDVEISGNNMTLTGHPDDNVTLVREYNVTAIDDAQMLVNYKHTTFRNGEVINVREQYVRYEKVTADYSEAILGTWEGQTSEGLNVRWEIKADGTYVYSRKIDDGDWETMVDFFNEYFADGYLFCARWKNVDDGMGEQRQWWEIESIQDGVMKWKALCQNEDGSTFIITAEMNKKQ